jgi:ketosteroid isomerase-like protein
MKSDREIKELKDRIAILEQKELIKDVIHSYAYFVDSKKMDELMALFHSDVKFHYINVNLRYKGKPDTKKFYQGIFDTYDLILHKIMNTMIRVKGQNASAQSYWMVYETIKGGGERSGEGRYYHKFVKTADGWKIKEIVIEGAYFRIAKQDVLARASSPR